MSDSISWAFFGAILSSIVIDEFDELVSNLSLSVSLIKSSNSKIKV